MAPTQTPLALYGSLPPARLNRESRPPENFAGARLIASPAVRLVTTCPLEP